MTARQCLGYRILDLGPCTRRLGDYDDTLAPSGPRAWASAMYGPQSRGRARARADRMNGDYGGGRYTVVMILDDDPDGSHYLGGGQ